MTNKQQNEMEMRHWNLIDRLKCQLKNNKKIGRICTYYSTPIKHLHKYKFKKQKKTSICLYQ